MPVIANRFIATLLFIPLSHLKLFIWINPSNSIIFKIHRVNLRLMLSIKFNCRYIKLQSLYNQLNYMEILLFPFVLPSEDFSHWTAVAPSQSYILYSCRHEYFYVKWDNYLTLTLRRLLLSLLFLFLKNPRIYAYNAEPNRIM